VSTPVPTLDSQSSFSAARPESTCKLCCNFWFPCEFCPSVAVIFLLLHLGVARLAELGFSLHALHHWSWCADSFWLSGFSAPAAHFGVTVLTSAPGFSTQVLPLVLGSCAGSKPWFLQRASKIGFSRSWAFLFHEILVGPPARIFTRSSLSIRLGLETRTHTRARAVRLARCRFWASLKDPCTAALVFGSLVARDFAGRFWF
jgi:hypothetical protein